VGVRIYIPARTVKSTVPITGVPLTGRKPTDMLGFAWGNSLRLISPARPGRAPSFITHRGVMPHPRSMALPRLGLAWRNTDEMSPRSAGIRCFREALGWQRHRINLTQSTFRQGLRMAKATSEHRPKNHVLCAHLSRYSATDACGHPHPALEANGFEVTALALAGVTVLRPRFDIPEPSHFEQLSRPGRQTNSHSSGRYPLTPGLNDALEAARTAHFWKIHNAPGPTSF